MLLTAQNAVKLRWGMKGFVVNVFSSLTSPDLIAVKVGASCLSVNFVQCVEGK